MVRGWLSVCVGIVMLGTVAIADDVADAVEVFHEVLITVESANTIELTGEDPVITASPLEERSTTIVEGLRYSVNNVSMSEPWKITVRVEEQEGIWYRLSVEASVIGHSGGSAVAGGVLLVDDGAVQDEADLITEIGESGVHTAHLEYTVAAVDWAVSVGAEATVQVIYRLTEA